MGMFIQGQELTDKQMAAILPVINEYSQKPRINKKQMEKDCLEAMEKADCALVIPVSIK